jgi:hypothetical protein
MITFTLEIAIGNEAMREVDDVARALVEAGEKMAQDGNGYGNIQDASGNTVGEYRFEHR